MSLPQKSHDIEKGIKNDIWWWNSNSIYGLSFKNLWYERQLLACKKYWTDFIEKLILAHSCFMEGEVVKATNSWSLDWTNLSQSSVSVRHVPLVDSSKLVSWYEKHNDGIIISLYGQINEKVHMHVITHHLEVAGLCDRLLLQYGWWW